MTTQLNNSGLKNHSTNDCSKGRSFTRSRTVRLLVAAVLVAITAMAASVSSAQEPRRTVRVHNVQAHYSLIPKDIYRQGEFNFDVKGHGPYGKDHYQGITRKGEAVYLSSSFPNGAGRVLVIAKKTYKLFGAKMTIPEVVNEIHTDEYWHLGGMDISGDYLAVAAENDVDGAVLIYDIVDPFNPVLVHELPIPGKVGAVGITEDASGRMLLAVTGGSDSSIHMYRSSTDAVESDGFVFLRHSTIASMDPAYQSLSLVTQADGSIFLFGTCNTAGGLPVGKNRVRMMQLQDMDWAGVDMFLTSYFDHKDIDLWQGWIWGHDVWKAPNFAAGGGVVFNEFGMLEVWAAPHGNRNGGELRYSTTSFDW